MKCNEENVQNVMTKLYRVLTKKIQVQMIA